MGWESHSRSVKLEHRPQRKEGVSLCECLRETIPGKGNNTSEDPGEGTCSTYSSESQARETGRKRWRLARDHSGIHVRVRFCWHLLCFWKVLIREVVSRCHLDNLGKGISSDNWANVLGKLFGDGQSATVTCGEEEPIQVSWMLWGSVKMGFTQPTVSFLLLRALWRCPSSVESGKGELGVRQNASHKSASPGPSTWSKFREEKGEPTADLSMGSSGAMSVTGICPFF